MKRILLYVHFNSTNELSPHVVYQLEQLREIFDKVVFISNSKLSVVDLDLLKNKELIDEFIQRENKGFDFGAWRDGMIGQGFDNLSKYDSVTIMNDTCFGPVYDFNSTFEKFEKNSEVDFWGITNNRKHKVNVDGEITLPEHIQSYFISFKSQVVNSNAFKDFWENIEDIEDDVVQVILRYETQLTKIFTDAGFKYDVMFNTVNEDFTGMLSHDFSIFSMQQILKRRIPFIKVKSFIFNSEDIYTPIIVQNLERISDYPIHYIIDHMTKVDYPDRNYMLDYKMIVTDESISIKSKYKYAIHLHAYYTDLVEEFLEQFSKMEFDFDLFITTDTQDKVKEIGKIIDNFPLRNLNDFEIYATGNKGRDVLPWMKISDKLKKYDVVGHFHCKKSEANSWIVGESWRKDLQEMLISQSSKMVDAFENNEDVGLIIPDVPSFFKNYYGPTYINEEKLFPKMHELWDLISFESKKELKKQPTYTMSYGTMVWYRPKALENLLSLDIEEIIPSEPLPYDSILHAFERILVYVAWANNYDFRIIASHRPTSGIIDNRSANLMLSKEVDTKQVDWDNLGGKRAARYAIKQTKSRIKRILKFW